MNKENKTITNPQEIRRILDEELLNEDTIITLFNLNKDVVTLKVSDLLPYGFDKGDLNE